MFYMLPVYNPTNNTWIVQKRDGTLKTISDKLYRRVFLSKIKTRYDGDAQVSTGD